MIILLSPAKKLAFKTDTSAQLYSQPEFTEKSRQLINKLSKLSRRKIGQLMHLSPNLAELNYNRYQAWQLPFEASNAQQAIYSFRGDVYIGLDADSMTGDDLSYAQEYLRILSGLHGILRPLDLIQPHRLEMGTRLPVRRKKNLYEFWKTSIAEFLKKDFEGDDNPVIINLASQEYFKAVNPTKLNARIINCHFKEFKGDELKAIMVFVKNARGSMARYIVDNRLQDPEDMKSFDRDGYVFREDLSSENDWMFVR